MSWLWLYSQCLSPLKLWVRTLLRRGILDTTLCDKVYHWLAIGQWFSPGTPVSSTNKTDRHHISEILLKVALNTINHKPSFQTENLRKVLNQVSYYRLHEDCGWPWHMKLMGSKILPCPWWTINFSCMKSK